MKEIYYRTSVFHPQEPLDYQALVLRLDKSQVQHHHHHQTGPNSHTTATVTGNYHFLYHSNQHHAPKQPPKTNVPAGGTSGSKNKGPALPGQTKVKHKKNELPSVGIVNITIIKKLPPNHHVAPDQNGGGGARGGGVGVEASGNHQGTGGNRMTMLRQMAQTAAATRTVRFDSHASGTGGTGSDSAEDKDDDNNEGHETQISAQRNAFLKERSYMAIDPILQ